jgi:hypothetical protein
MDSTDELLRLIARACDGRLPAEEHQRLAQQLLGDESARSQYANFCQLEADLYFRVRANRAGRKAAKVVAPRHALSRRQRSLGLIFLAGAVTATLAASLVLWLGTGGWRRSAPEILAPSNAENVAQQSPPAGEGSSAGSDRPEFVARIVRVSPNFAWKQPAVVDDFLLRVKPGDKLEVAQGILQLEFSAGAKIILHAPAQFTPTSATTGHLESGQLTGEVSEGNFHLTTPAAEVIDLGTEFGVQVDSDKSTDVVVFNGRVQVVGTSGARDALDMTQGMAARIRSDGTKQFGIDTEVGHFARSVPAGAQGRNKNQLSVVDVLCGGDGFDAGLSGAADPLTGKQDHGERKPDRLRTNGNYHLVEWNPIVDGVFIPPPDGVRTQIDSSGTTVDLPQSNGLTWGPLWARRWESTLQTAGITKDFWERKTLKNILVRLKQTKFGMIGMHANIGFTLDLRAVRLLQRRDVDAFLGIVTNLDNSLEEYKEDAKHHQRTADLRVLVDGELRYQRLGFKRDDGDKEFAIQLQPRDRFLTVIAGDAEKDTAYDHVVLIDPVITLQTTKAQPIEEN